jgi:thiamine biosynthesis lipoprotein
MLVLKPTHSIIGLVIFLASIFSVGPVSAAWLSDEQTIMGTSIRIELWSENKKSGRKVIAKVINEMHRIDRLMSPFKKNSELSKINNEAGKQPVVISKEILSLIEKSLTISKQTNGAFDITFASAGFMYDYRQHKHPDKKSLEQILPSINYQHIQINHSKQSIFFKDKGVKIDLGGIAKGYAVDRGIAIFKKHGIKHGIISAGGDSRILGDRQGRPWFVGVRDPRNRQGLVAKLPVRNEAISTSGDYERFFEKDGIRYHHILSPGTGKSVRHVRSATVLGPDATTTDALSTSVFVLGSEKGLALINQLPDFEAIIIDQQGALIYSDGFKRLQQKIGQKKDKSGTN